MVMVRNPVLEEGLTVLKNEGKLHKLPGIYVLYLLILFLLSGPREILPYAATSAVPLFHLFLWIGIIIGCIGINLYWAGNGRLIYKYSTLPKWFLYAGITPWQFFSGKVLLACAETILFVLLSIPFVVVSMAVTGFLPGHVMIVILFIFLNVFNCRVISLYFQSTVKDSGFPFSLNFLFMYFWIILLYIGTLFFFPYANVFAVLLTLEPSTAYLFESLIRISMIRVPLLYQLSTAVSGTLPAWLISFCIHCIILIAFSISFYISLIIKKHALTNAKEKTGSIIPGVPVERK